MKLTFDPEQLREQAKLMTQFAEDMSVEIDNTYWKLHLQDYERIMEEDYIHNYKVKALGLVEEEFARYASIRSTYEDLEKFYDETVELIRRERALGIEREGQIISFDITLTKEQAYEKYCPVDRETAQKTKEVMDKIDKKAVYYEKGIREAYTGDLSSQLGMPKEPYIAKAEEEKKAFAKAAKALENYEKEIDANRPKMSEEEKEDFRTRWDGFIDQVTKDYEKIQEERQNGPTL